MKTLIFTTLICYAIFAIIILVIWSEKQVRVEEQHFNMQGELIWRNSSVAGTVRIKIIGTVVFFVICSVCPIMQLWFYLEHER